MTKELRIHNGERIVSAIEDVGKTRPSHAKKNKTGLIPHIIC